MCAYDRACVFVRVCLCSCVCVRARACARARVSVCSCVQFVTREDLEKLSLSALVGTSALRPYMHGFFIDSRLYAKAESLSQPFAYEQWRQERLKEKVAAKTKGRIAPVVKPKVKVNADFVDELVSADKKAARSKKAVAPAVVPMKTCLPCVRKSTLSKAE